MSKELKGTSGLTSSELYKLLGQIGNTPIYPIGLVIDGVVRTVNLKLEGKNPAGSIKDRTGYSLVRDLEEGGILDRESVIIESTSGNLGVALSLVCRAKGYPFVAVVDPKITPETLANMEALGTQIEMVHEADDTGSYLLRRLERVQELCQSSSRYVWTNQYANPANPWIHYAQTGPEIYRQMKGKVDALFAAVSTGGTLAGLGRYFREVSPATRIIGVDARGSVVFGGVPAPRCLTGIGSARPSNFIVPLLYDMSTTIDDEEAFCFCHALFAAVGIKVGGSSGAVLAACARYLPAHPEVTGVVCICADNGENYTSTIFSEPWLQAHGFHFSLNDLGSVTEIIPVSPSPWSSCISRKRNALPFTERLMRSAEIRQEKANDSPQR